MGNIVASPANALMELPLGKAYLTKHEAISADGIATAPVSLKVGASWINGLGVSTTNIMDAASGATQYVTTARQGLTTLTITVTDAAGNLVCVAKGKRQAITAQFKVLTPEPAYIGQPAADVHRAKATRKKSALVVKGAEAPLYDRQVPLYERAEGKLKMGLTTASCEYSTLDKAGAYVPLYTAKKARALGFLLRVEGVDGQLLGKVAQTGFCPNKIVVELGAGVDVVACLLLSAMVGAASGSGGAAVGGLAGAGAI